MQHSKTSTVVGSSGDSLASGIEFLGRVRDERGIDERGLDQFFKHGAGDFEILVFLADFRAEIDARAGGVRRA